MLIGVPREAYRHEHRVGLTPAAVEDLVRRGHAVLVEHDAGIAAHFTDRDFEGRGAQIAWRSEEIYRRSDLVCRLGAVAPEELELFRPELIVASFHHLAVARRELVERLMQLAATLIGYEVIRDRAGGLPVLWPMSEMAGRMAVQVAAHYLQNEAGGRGILLGNVPGVPPPTVLILGAGTVGRTAAREALASGAHVLMVDADVAKLRAVHRECDGRVVTAVASPDRLARYTAFADVVIGAVLIPGGRAPYLVSAEMVQKMKPGSVIVDLSIDQGGCVETSRPTRPDDPVFKAHGVIHYCVPNMTANIARTASRAMANAVLPYVRELADRGLAEALRRRPGLAAGVYLYRGHLVSRIAGEALGLATSDLETLLGEAGG